MKRDSSLDVIRVLAIWMIVNYHFAAVMGLSHWFLCAYTNGGWGSVGTTVFFVLSGYVLHMKYKKTGNIFKFYGKRLLSIYPMFWIAFLCSWLYIIIDTGKAYYNGSPSKLWYTLFAVDGYVKYWGVSTYYRGVGEWFTAVIVVIYLLYPLMNLLFRKAKVLGTILIAGLYFWNIIYNPFAPVPVDSNLITGVFMFWIGMLLEQYSVQIKKHLSLLIAFIPLGLVIITVKLPGPNLPWKNLLGILVFLVLWLVFSRISFKGIVQKTLTYLSSISFAVYLTHHFILIMWKPYIINELTSAKRVLAFYICYMALTIMCSVLINTLTNLVTGKYFRKKKVK